MGGRADLHGAAVRPLHLLRRKVPTALGPGGSLMPKWTQVGRSLETQLLGLWTAQTLEGRPPGRARRGRDQVARLMNGPGHPRCEPGQESLHHQVRSNARPGARPRATATSWLPVRTTCGSPTSRIARRGRCIVYVAFIIDVFSRRLVGWKAARSMTASLVDRCAQHGGMDPTAHHDRFLEIPRFESRSPVSTTPPVNTPTVSFELRFGSSRGSLCSCTQHAMSQIVRRVQECRDGNGQGRQGVGDQVPRRGCRTGDRRSRSRWPLRLRINPHHPFLLIAMLRAGTTASLFRRAIR